MTSKKHPFFLQEWVLLISFGSLAFFLSQGTSWLENTTGYLKEFLFLWLFAAILVSSFSIVRHADVLAEKLGEPYGTLILTLAVTGIEVMMISAVMLTDNSPTLARDTMFSVVMILLGGVLGLCLLIGGFRFHEQHFNLKGGKAFLGLILPLSVLSLIMPNFTAGRSGVFSEVHALSMVVLSTTIYFIFLAVQTRWHTEFFLESSMLNSQGQQNHPASVSYSSVRKELRVIFFHTVMLLCYIPPVILLSKKLALLLALKKHGGYDGLFTDSVRTAIDGFVVAILILAPEGLAAIQAARKNQMQRSVNILLGSVLATIGLTVPAALGISLLIGHPIHLGLDATDVTLLVMTLGSCLITFSQGETNVFQGFVHLMLFAVYIVLMFD